MVTAALIDRRKGREFVKASFFRCRLSVEQRRMRVGYLFCLPLIFGLVLLFIPSIVQTVIFTLNDLEVDPTGNGYSLLWVGLHNYRRALTENPQFLIHLKTRYQACLSTCR